jgi:hypothetical protein
MTGYLTVAQAVTAPRAQLNPGGEDQPPFVVVKLNKLAYLTFATPEAAYAVRDAVQLAGDMLANLEETAS